MYSSLLALACFFAAAGPSENPAWLTDYSEARHQAGSDNRPLFVAIGSGDAGWNQVSREGRLGKEIQRLLAANYVCVYVDTNQRSGRRLAQAFEIPEAPGIVISDATGRLQAFRHEGDLANETMAKYLRCYADPERDVRFTETNPGGLAEDRSSVVPVYYRSFGRGC